MIERLTEIGEQVCDWRGGLGYLLLCAATVPAGWVAIWLFGRMWQ